MANHARGSATIHIAGKDYPIAFNLGVVAELASGLDVKTFQDLQKRIEKVEFVDMPVVLKAVLVANGHSISAADINLVNFWDYLEIILPTIFNPRPNKDAAGNAPKQETPAPQ
jgi:hypothetical protein